MRLQGALVILTAVVLSSCTSLTCPRPARPAADAGDLRPGLYELALHATEGSRSGAVARGQLWLRRTTSQDRPEVPFYGWAKIDFTAVGAPVIPGDGPSPASTDPASPGVLVHVIDWKKQYPPGTPVLTVGTNSNYNPVVSGGPDGVEVIKMSTDGSGIGLWVHEAREGSFTGRWEEWGIVQDGRGFFCATLVEETD